MIDQELLDKVFRFLSYRPRSAKEIQDYLKKKTPSEKKSLEIIKRLKEMKLFNDQEFCQWWIEQRNTFRPRGKRALWYELRQKGIDEKLAKPMIEEMVNELDLAKKVLKKKNGTRTQLTGFLARRGFSWQTIKEVLKT